MKLTDDLKNKIDGAKSKEEVKEIFEESGLELTDTELDQVAGAQPLFDIPKP